MPVITRLELEDAQKDVETIGKVVNGAADLPNPGKDPGTVTARQGSVIKTLSKLVADGQETVTARLTPLVYNSTVERENAINSVSAGQTAFDKEDTNLHIAIPADEPEFDGQLIWSQVSNLQLAASADIIDLMFRNSSVGRVSVDDHFFLNDREKVYDKDALEVHHIEFPISTGTAEDGLENLLNYHPLPTGHFWQRGIHYGCRIPDGDLKNPTATEELLENGGTIDWLPETTRIMFRNDNINLIQGYLINGHIDINSGYQKTAYIRDCVIDSQYTKLQCISKANGPEYPVNIDYCTLRRFTSEATSVLGGSMSFCDISLSRGDGVKAGGNDVVIHGNMVRLLGQDLPSAHADGIQILDCQRLEITQNMFYMPGTGSHWDEATNGTTNCLRLVTENAAHSLEDVYVAGNVFAGGGFTIAVRARFLGSLVQNVAIVNNVIAGPTQVEGAGTAHPFWVYGPITTEHWIENSPGTFRNLIIWGNKITDGSALASEGVDGTDQQGLWHYDKAYATPRFLELGKRLGLLDWNGDPLVTVRTTG